jgi:hypothetical protein
MAAFGVALLQRLTPELTTLEQLSYGAVLGLVLATLALVPAATLLGFGPGLVIADGIACGLGALALHRHRRPGTSSGGARRRFSWPLDLLGTILLVGFTARWALLWATALEIRPDGLWAGHEYIWSDWPTHLGIVTAFAWGDNFPPEHTLFAGLPLAYHYLSDLTPAAYVVLGLSPIQALPLHSFLLSVVAFLCLWAFARRVGGRRRTASLAVLFVLLGAGLGWIADVGRVAGTADPLGTLLADPWDPQTQTAAHIRVFNVYLAFFMSQRAYLYGLPIAFLSLTLARQAVRLRGQRQIQRFLLGGVVAGLLPLSHLPTLLAMALLVPCLALLLQARPWDLRSLPWRGWITFGTVWVLVALPQLLVQLGGSPGALSFTRLEPGWVASEAPYRDTWWWFWLKNAGVLGILTAVGLALPLVAELRLAAQRRRLPASASLTPPDPHPVGLAPTLPHGIVPPGGSRLLRLLLPPRGFRFLLAFQAIFLVVNLVVFQPWDWDNHKILVYWLVAAAISSGAVIDRLWRGRGAATVRRLAALALVVAIVAGPALENLDMLEGHGRYRMLDADQLALADAIRRETPPRALFVTGMEDHDPVSMLTGRRLLMGYWGQLWVSGIPFATRQADVLAIYHGGPDVPELIARYGVDYVVIGPGELAPAVGADLAAFEARYRIAFQVGPYLVFDVRRPAGG